MIQGRPVPADRLPCLVPGCGRTFKRQSVESEVVCSKHYRLAPKAMRDRLTSLRSLYRKLERRGRPSGGTAWRCDQQWCEIREAILSAAAGKIDPAELAAFLEQI